jgi:hypothetical protein
VQILSAAVVWQLAMQLLVLAMLWALVLAIQSLVLVVMQFPLYRKQFFHRVAKWFAFLRAHFSAPMISLNSRPYSLPEYEAG